MVKELVENAIDAKSTQIDIEVENAGLKTIRISDNGTGISRDDVELAFKKHSTSKISELEDLDRLQTLGFRGEALPSIASVSRVEMITKLRRKSSESDGDDAGVKLYMEAGTVISLQEAGCPEGTIIKISDLFYNVPARKKFLKNPKTEMAHITDWVMRFAIAYPGIRFRLVKDGSEIIATPKTGNLKDTLVAIFGSSFVKELIPVDYSDEQFSVLGFIGKPILSHRDRSYQFIYVNGRYISSQVISRALMEAYHTLLMKHKYPTAVLNFQIDPAKLDVNIHPTKIQVRFEQEKKIYEALVQAVRSILDKSNLIPELGIGEPETEHGHETDSAYLDRQPRLPGTEPVVTEQENSGMHIDGTLNIAPHQAVLDPESIDDIEKLDAAVMQEDFSKDDRLQEFSNVIPLAQLHNMYLLVQTDNGLVIIDQHALHERVMYEKLKNLYASGPVMSQELISPVSFEFNSRDFDVLIGYRTVLKDLGFEIESFGKNTVLVRSVPTVFGRLEDKTVLNDILDDLLSTGRVRGEELQREKFIQILACKSAIKAGQRLGKQEIVQLLRTIPDLSSPFACAHGRPTILSLPLKELEKQFKRVV